MGAREREGVNCLVVESVFCVSKNGEEVCGDRGKTFVQILCGLVSPSIFL